MADREFYVSSKSTVGDGATTSTDQTKLSTKALAGGAVEKEVNGVVGVHQQFGGSQRQTHAARRHRSVGSPRRSGRPNKVLDKCREP